MTVLDSTSIRRQVLPAERPEAVGPRAISVAYTPDSDDVFNFHAWETGKVGLPEFRPAFHRNHISVLNHAAASGLHDVVNVSAVMYPVLADRYRILAVGTSVGRGYGPVLVAATERDIDSLAGARVAVADISTTGGVLARLACPPETIFVTRPYHRIADAVLDGEVDAGVMIHEELVHFPELGLHQVLDLGADWLQRTGLPLPVGLNLVRRSLGLDAARRIVRVCRASLAWGLAHPDEALAAANRFGRGRAEQFIPMFSNDDTLRFPEDVRAGLRLLLERVADLGLGPRLTAEQMEIVDA